MSCVCVSVLTLYGQGGPQCVNLRRTLVRVHAVTQRQLRHSTAELAPEIIRDRIIVLSGVCERLEEKTHKITKADKCR